MSLTAERLREVLLYRKTTGCFTWRVKTGRNVIIGSLAGTVGHDGYVRIKIDGKLYVAQRLAWLYVTGEWPKGEVDHRDLSRANNRWGNLRDATSSQQKFNVPGRKGSKTGVKGVYLTTHGTFKVQMQAAGEFIYLGTFPTLDAASAAREAKARELHGEFFYEGED